MKEPSTKQIINLVDDLILPFHEVKRQHKLPIARHRLENDALKKIKIEYSTFPWLHRTIEEYESMDCDEAVFVYSVDKYIAVVYDLLDKGLYLQQIGIDKKKYDELMESHRAKAHKHPLMGRYYDDIRTYIDRDPEFMLTKT